VKKFVEEHPILTFLLVSGAINAAVILVDQWLRPPPRRFVPVPPPSVLPSDFSSDLRTVN